MTNKLQDFEVYVEHILLMNGKAINLKLEVDSLI
jgi:hypothetical protein